MNLVHLLIVVLLIVLIAGLLPVGPFVGYGYWPSGIVGILLLVLVILAVTGRI